MTPPPAGRAQGALARRSVRAALVVLTATLGPGLAAAAQDSIPAEPEPAADDRQDRGAGGQTAVLPVAYYTPETSVALGALYARVWIPLASAGVRESSLMLNATYTLRNQLVLSHLGQFEPRPDRLYSSLLTAALKWPDRFYPVGNEAGSDAYEEWTARRIEAQLAGLRRVGARPLFVGPVVTLAHHDILEAEDGGLLASGAIPGAARHTLLGAGLRATWDSRDAAVWPRSGGFHQATLTGHTSVSGADFGLGRFETDMRWYRAAGPGVVALWSRLIAAWGRVPFTMHARIGGLAGGLRGVYETRYADRTAALLVIEYRQPLIGRLGVVAFAGTGRVARTIRELAVDGLHFGAGGGLRFALLPESQLNVGIDLAAGRDGTQMYINLGEAF